MHDSDDMDFILREQEDYEMANFLKDLDEESERVTEDCIRNMNPSQSDQNDYHTADSNDRLSRRDSYTPGSCGNCILYALIAIAIMIAFGYLVSALS